MSEKKIPHYINDPKTNKLTAPENKLYRPEIHFGKAVIITISTIFLTLLISWLITLVLIHRGIYNIEQNGQLAIFISIYWKIQLLVLLLTLKYIFILFIRIYQRYAKSETRLRCCYTPSCSEYAILALKKYGLIFGSIKAVKRLLRCGPPGGIDYP